MPFLIVDCNNFFVSCERVFDASLVDRPTIVLSNNDGCIVSRSQEAKDLGFGMGDPEFKCREKILRHDVAVRSANFALYGDMSNRVMQTLSSFSDRMEMYSIDEAFLRLDSELRPDQIDSLTLEIQRRVQKWTGIPVSIGVAPTKTLAKIANAFAKRRAELQRAVRFDGNAAEMDPILGELPVEKIWGIGRRSGAAMRSYGIRTALALKNAPEVVVRKRLGVSGVRIQRELQGTPCLMLDLATSRKMVLCSRSFGRPVTDIGELREAVALHTARAAEKLRRQGSAAQMLQVSMRTNRFRTESPQTIDSGFVTLEVATNYTPALVAAAHTVVDRIYKPGYAYRKAGVLMMDLCPENAVQLNLFDDCLTNGRRAQNRELMRTVDSLNRKIGDGAVFLASTGLKRPWQGRQERRSPRYTTCWSEMFTVDC